VYGLRVIGTVRVLLDAKSAGVVPSVADTLQAMRSRGYWLSERIVEAATRAAGESRSDQTPQNGERTSLS
jgi:predicted nucleic acid-binding protein